MRRTKKKPISVVATVEKRMHEYELEHQRSLELGKFTQRLLELEKQMANPPHTYGSSLRRKP